MNKANYKLINIMLVLIIIYLLFVLKDLWLSFASTLYQILKPFLISFTIAYAFNPFLKWLQKKNIPKSISILIIVTIIILFISFIVISLIPIFSEQLISLFNSTIKFIGEMKIKYNLNLDSISEHLSHVFNKITYNLGSKIPFSIINVFTASVSFISNIIIIIVSFIYFLYYMDDIRNSIKNVFKNKNIYKLINNIDYETSMYFKGLFLTLIIQFFEYTIIFYIIGHPNFLLLGILTSISTLIPYFGGLIVNIIALIIASVISKKVFILTLLVALILPNIDGYLISPKIYGKTNNISPLLNIFAVFSGGIIGGFTGIIISLPIIIIIRAIYKYYKNDDKFSNMRLKI